MKFAEFGETLMAAITGNLPGCPLMYIDVRSLEHNNDESAQVPGHIRILPKHIEHMLMNKILKLNHMIVRWRAGSEEVLQSDVFVLKENHIRTDVVLSKRSRRTLTQLITVSLKLPSTYQSRFSFPKSSKKSSFLAPWVDSLFVSYGFSDFFSPHNSWRRLLISDLLGDCDLTAPRQRGHGWGGDVVILGLCHGASPSMNPSLKRLPRETPSTGKEVWNHLQPINESHQRKSKKWPGIWSCPC